MAQEVIQGRSITPDPTTHKELNSWFKNYEITELDLSALSRMANKEDARISLQIHQKIKIMYFKHFFTHKPPDFICYALLLKTQYSVRGDNTM